MTKRELILALEEIYEDDDAEVLFLCRDDRVRVFEPLALDGFIIIGEIE